MPFSSKKKFVLFAGALTSAPAPVITTDPNTGGSFFAELADDPFFFDIPAELRYRASPIAGSPDPSFFKRGRGAIAGYNNLMIALSVPASLLRGQAVASKGINKERSIYETQLHSLQHNRSADRVGHSNSRVECT